MKKIVIILISILIAIFAILFALGSRGEYAAEKFLYRAMKVNSGIAENPDVIPPKFVEYVENNLKKILDKYPRSEVAKTAAVQLAEFYIFEKKYDDALVTLDYMIKTYDKNRALLSTARFLKGRVYEKQDKWPKALKEYEIVRDNYTDTQLGLQTPLYIAKYYADKGRDAEERQAYDDAALFYGKLQKENSGKVMGYIASTLLLQTYITAGNYEKAGSVLEDTIKNYMSRLTLTQLLPLVEEIFVNKLKMNEKAKEIYKTVKEKMDDRQLKEILEAKIAKL